MLRILPLLLALAGCSNAPQKSLAPDLGNFETAFVETGRTDDAWSVSHIVRNGRDYVLVIYIRRADGRPAGISHMSDTSSPVQRIQVNGIGGAVISQTSSEMENAAISGFQTTLCGTLGCYLVNVPATLYQQALLE